MKTCIVEAIKALVKIDADWIPQKEGTALYIRPFIIADEAFLGVRRSNHYKFIIILSPVGPYYVGGLTPTKLYVEDKYVRATDGGTGEAKCGGNYAASLKAQEEAHAKGYEQILWLDGVHRKYVEEVGTSNAFFVIGDEVVTAPLDGTMPAGYCGKTSVFADPEKERRQGCQKERLPLTRSFRLTRMASSRKCCASGTAAVISPVGELRYKDEDMIIDDGEDRTDRTGTVRYDLRNPRTGELPDDMGWTVEVK